MKSWIFLLLSVGVVAILGSCAHEEKQEDVTKHYTSDTFEVSASGGDDRLLRSTSSSDQIEITGYLRVKGVNQKYMAGRNVQLVDRDGTIFAKTRTSSVGGFRLMGSVPAGNYMIRIVDPKFKGELAVQVNGAELKNLTVPVQPVIR